MDTKKVNVLVGFSILFFYSITLLMIKCPASYTTSSPVALLWPEVPLISLEKAL